MAADELPPTERTIAIANIFSHFHNPAKETVLTPWRVVNLHLSDTLGGWCFYDEDFRENEETYYHRLQQPRFVDQGEVTAKTLCNPDAKILEINSKSGLYPLYAAYSLYRTILGERTESSMLPQQLYDIWDEAALHVYVLCQSSMAAAITRHTLFGFRDVKTHIRYDEKLLDSLNTSIQDTTKVIQKGSYWKEGATTMKFDAIIGNPPYQAITGGGSEVTAAAQAKPIFQLFVQQGKMLNPQFLSMIIPARWYNGGIGLNDFRSEMLKDRQIVELVDYSNSKELFPTVDIAGGICYFLWQAMYDGECNIVNTLAGSRSELKRSLDQFGDFFIRSNAAISIIDKVKSKSSSFVSDMVSAIDTFGIPSKEKGHSEYNDGDVLLLHSTGANSQGVDYVSRSSVTKNSHLINKFKIKISILVPQNGEVGVAYEKGYRSISTPQILYPGTVDSFSYLNIGFFDTEEEAINFRGFMTCKFPRFMMRATYSSVHISKSNFIFVPMMDFTKTWSDEKLYNYFGLSEDEKSLIEKTMRPFVLEKDDIGKEFYEEHIRQTGEAHGRNQD